MQRVPTRKTAAIAVAASLLSIGAFSGAGTANAYASGCSGGLPSAGGTYTGSKCNVLTNGSSQRSVQWCTQVGYGYQYGAIKNTGGTWSNTPACPGAPVTYRNQQIF